MLDFTVQPSQVESIQDIIFINLAKVLVSLCVQKPVYPVFRVVAITTTAQVVHCNLKYGQFSLSQVRSVQVKSGPIKSKQFI